jgi:dihydroorotate dehydrogenase
VKLSPDSDALEGSIRDAESAGADGFIVGNTTIARPGVAESLPGGLSGAPLGPIALDRLRRAVITTRLPVIASGGVMTPDDVVERLATGAALVQLYTGLVYAGPGLLKRSLERLGG